MEPDERADSDARRWMRWQKGRQNTGYDKLLIASTVCSSIRCYCAFPEGIPPTVLIMRSPSGGEFICANPIFRSSRVNVFRSDVRMHSVSRVVGGTRYVLSIGWVLPA